MNKRIFSIILCVILSMALTACNKEEKEVSTDTSISETASSVTQTVETDEQFAIVTNNVKVAQYKNLSINGYNEEVSESEINSFIDYVLQYAYIPSVMSDDEEADPVILTYEDLTDELVVEITEGEYTNIADYREYIKGLVKEENAGYFENSAKNQLFSQVIENSELVGFDEEDFKNYVDYANEYYAEYAQYLGVDMDTFKKETLNFTTEDEYTEFVEDEAMANLKTEYIILAIAKEEGIDISEADIDAEVQNYITSGYFGTEAEVLDYITRDEISVNLKYYKILDLIFSTANVVPYEQTIDIDASSDIIVPDVDGNDNP